MSLPVHHQPQMVHVKIPLPCKLLQCAFLHLVQFQIARCSRSYALIATVWRSLRNSNLSGNLWLTRWLPTTSIFVENERLLYCALNTLASLRTQQIRFWQWWWHTSWEFVLQHVDTKKCNLFGMHACAPHLANGNALRIYDRQSTC